jgi:HAD superfamily hydrolase (TIGR01484 family)
MRYHAIAADYDGTLAHHGVIDEPTWAALRRLRDSGRKAIMVTGRQLEELLGLLRHPEVFDRIVAENGAVLYCPETRETRTLGIPPPPSFVDELKRHGVDRVAVGHVIVATWEPHQDTVFHVIREQCLELQVIFNKRAVMVLPSGINKATGLCAALHDLTLSPHNVVGVGDAENDHALLERCECGVAVANALDALKKHADVVTEGDHGAGVIELVDHLITDDLQIAVPNLARHKVLLGMAGDDRITIDPYSANVMVCGKSGSGKSTLTTGLLERLAGNEYQFAIVDPEGDYLTLDMAVVLGGPKRAPLIEEIVDVLRDPLRNCVINLLGVAVDHRPEFFTQLTPALSDLRSRTGRPHWLAIDEAHHLLPASWEPADELSLRPRGTLYVTVHPGSVSKKVIRTIDTLIAVGENPAQTLREFCAATFDVCPLVEAPDKLSRGEVVYWKVGEPKAIVVLAEPPKTERLRHSRKYVEGNLGTDRSFYFRGPRGRLNLKAHNLQMFVHLANGVDNDTWLYHLRKGEYSNWFRTEIKDRELAAVTERIERDRKITANDSRAKIRAAIERRYTLPADKPSGIVDL